MKNVWCVQVFGVTLQPENWIISGYPKKITLIYNKEKNLFIENDEKCVSCLRCVAFCPTHALKIVKNDSGFKSNYNWDDDTIKAVIRQSSTGGILLSSMGSPVKKKIYWDSIVINASQVTNPSIDPLREPMETRVFLGSKDQSIERDERGKIIKKKINMSDEFKTDKLIYRVPTFYFTIYIEVKKSQSLKKKNILLSILLRH